MAQEGRQTHISQDFHICQIHANKENHILSGKSDPLACLKLLTEKELRS